MRTLLLILILALFGVTPWATAQSNKPQDYGIRSKKALKLYLEGRQLQGYRDHAGALARFQAAIAIEPQFADALKRAAIEAYLSEQPTLTIQYGALGTRLAPQNTIEAWFFLGKAYQDASQYGPAAQAFRDYLARNPNIQALRVQAETALASCAFADSAMRNPVPYNPVNLGPNVNSTGDEYMPTLPADGSFIFFTSQRAECTGGYNHETRMYEEDFYFSRRNADGSWGPAENLGPPINTDRSEGASCISADGRFVIFTACNHPQGRGSCDLFIAEYDGARWGRPANLGPAINTPFWESYPSLSNDGRTLYFTSSRPGGAGSGGRTDQDIWYSTFENGDWTPARNLGAVINTNQIDQSPFIHADGQTLYFSSFGHPGMGGADLFVSRRIGPGPADWGTPQNLGYPINTSGDERTLFVTTEGTTAYINSDRPGGIGGVDIYSFELPEQLRPRRATFVRGIVLDSLTRNFVPRAQVYFQNLTTGDTVRSVQSAPATGRFLLSLPLGQDYAAYIDAPGYLFRSQNFSLRNLQGQEYFDLTIELKKLEQNSVVRLENVFFDFDQATLKAESAIELNKLLTFLRENPRVRIEIRGHTDDKGADDYNLRLSQARAEAVRVWLINQGVTASRMEAKGYGETLPLVPNTTDENRALNRRTEFRIISVQ